MGIGVRLQPMKKRAAARKATPSEKRFCETRRLIKRIFAIHQAIRRGCSPNCRTLAEQIRVTPKTIQRDVTLAHQRGREASQGGVSLLRPADFSLSAHLGGSFGIWHNPNDWGELCRIWLRYREQD